MPKRKPEADGDLVWEEPPEAPARAAAPTGWGARLAPLRSKPDRWARVYAGNKSQAYAVGHNVRHGKYAGVEAGEFEVAVRPTSEDRDPQAEWGVWSRFVG
jgi:hypothetical protein